MKSNSMMVDSWVSARHGYSHTWWGSSAIPWLDSLLISSLVSFEPYNQQIAWFVTGKLPHASRLRTFLFWKFLLVGRLNGRYFSGIGFWKCQKPFLTQMGTIFNPNVREGERMERKFPRTEIHNLGIPREVVLFLEIPVRPQISVKFLPARNWILIGQRTYMKVCSSHSLHSRP